MKKVPYLLLYLAHKKIFRAIYKLELYAHNSIVSETIVPDKMRYSHNIFIFLHKNICCEYL